MESLECIGIITASFVCPDNLPMPVAYGLNKMAELKTFTRYMMIRGTIMSPFVTLMTGAARTSPYNGMRMM